MEGKRPPGRPRTLMLDRAKDGSSYVAFKRRAMITGTEEGPVCLQTENTHILCKNELFQGAGCFPSLST